jgi:hypothetical protein
MDLVGSDDKELLVPDAGHVGLMAGPVAKREVLPVAGRPEQRPDVPDHGPSRGHPGGGDEDEAAHGRGPAGCET